MIPINLLRSSSFRLAFLYMLLFGFSVLVLLSFIYWTTEGFIETQTEETVSAELLGLRERFELLGVAGLIHIINERIMNDFDHNSVYLLADAELNPLSGNLDRWPRTKESATGWLQFSLLTTKGVFIKNATARHIQLKSDFHLLVGRDDTEKVKTEQLIIKSMGWGFGLTILLGLAGGVLMSRSVLRRIEVINRASREIMQGDLGRRIPLKGVTDEFDQLIQNLNEMLHRIEELMSGIRQVSDNIAHDLRSPLNRLRSRLELTLLEKPDQEAYRVTLEQTITDIDELLGAFNALLKIAQAEAGLKIEDVAEVDLSALAHDMTDLYEPLAEEKNIAIKADILDGVLIHGNRHLLSQAVANLLDNAIKYTPQGGVVLIEVKREKKVVELTVADSGPGIPFEARDTVLQRFYRLEQSRSAPGSGLGLSLVAAVAKMHNARLTLEDNDPGLRAILVFSG
jgi:signal transduction histidine kinase